MSYNRVVRQPSHYKTFKDTQKKLDWYGSNPEGINRNRTSEAVYSDDFLAPEQEDKDSELSEDEWSRPTYSNVFRSPLLESSASSPNPSSSFFLKRKTKILFNASDN